VDQQAVDASPEEWMFAPNASGPFQLRERIEEDAVIFERNERYHTPAGVPYVVYLLYRPGPRLSYYEAEEIDITGVGNQEVPRVLEEDDPLHDQLNSTTSLCTTMVNLNNELPPMEDINFRKALALSVDRDDLLARFSENLGVRAVSILPPGMPGFSAEVSAAEFDPEAAKDALAASAYANEAIELTMLKSGYGDSESPLENAVIDMWREHLGIEVEIDYIDPLDFTQEARATDAHLLSFGWCADYPDPENFLDVLFHSQSDYNMVNYSNPAFDALLEEARVELDPNRRLALYQEAETLLLADYGTIPLRHAVSYILVNPRVQGYVHSPLRVAPYIHLLSIVPPE
jgi:ABC-type transport system substrate-binding protein